MKDENKVLDDILSSEKSKEETAIKEKRPAKTISLLFVIILFVLVNAAWFFGVEYIVIPKKEAQYISEIENKEEQIKSIKEDYDKQIEHYNDELTKINNMITEQEEMYNNAVKLIQQYGGTI